jgi:DNA-binding transcriptional LysR family regulator
VELHHLKTFLTVSKFDSISQASRELFLTQSSVTNRIKELERELGFPLFERVGRNIRLTSEGKAYIPYAQHGLSIMDEAAQQMDKHSQSKGIVTLSSMSNICTYVLPGWLAKFRKRYPDILIKIKTEHSRPIVDQVLRASIDIGLVRGPIHHNGLYSHPLYYEKIVPVASPEHPWCRKKHICITEFEGRTVIAYNRFSRIWARLEKWFGDHGVNVEIHFDLDHVETAKLMVLNGHGIAFLPFYTVQEEILQGKLGTFDIEPSFNLASKTDLIYNRRNQLPRHAKELVDFIIEISSIEGRIADES